MTRRLLVMAPALLVARVAAAQPAGDLQLDEFRPAMDARGFLTLNGSQVLDGDELSFGLGSLEWGRHLLAFSSPNASYSVDNVVSATLVGALGLRVAGVPFELGMSLPLTVVDGAHDLAGQGVGDLGLHAKARLLHLGPLGVGALASVYLPTASPRDRFLGETGVTPELDLIADLSLGRVRLAINAGVRDRPTATFTDTMMGTMGTITTSTDLPFGAAAAWALAPERVELVGEVFGSAPLAAHHGYQPLEALGGLKVYLAKSSYLSLGAGRGLLAQGGNPDLRAFIGIVFEPRPAETRAASVPDELEVASAPPPRPPPADDTADRDGDGVYDKDDRCPDDPGPMYNAGCPDRDGSIVTTTNIVPLRSIDFEFDSAKLRESSYPVLDSVVQALKDNPDIQLVEIQGHTDERGDDAYNLELSDRRAATVLAYLVAHGIAPARLISHGYGETRPLDRHHTEAAWAKNRRVEFVIQDRAP